jgi:colanic acid/amylovoran biosynthesis glycosyltransferase
MHNKTASANEVTSKGKPNTIAYLMSRFPKVSETFILYEILELERLGMQVEIFPLVHEHENVAHPEAQALVERAHYSRLATPAVLGAQFYWLFRCPAAYLRAWWDSIRGNFGSRKFLIRAAAIVPQAALFARQMEALGVKHLHAHYATHPALAAYVIHQLTGLPYSITAHAHDIYVERPMLEEKIRAASFVVAISEYNKRLLGELYGSAAAEKTIVIHCGIDPAVFQPRPIKERSGPFTIVCVASLQDYKGHPYLVDACAELKAQGLDFRCLCIGEGEDRPQIDAQIARHGLQDYVQLLGQQPRNRVSELLAQADVMVLPSVVTPSGKKEGIPVALMEALATELPVVATAISGIPELIEDGKTGLLAPQRDSHALAVALRRLYHEPELGKQFAAAGREKVLREFNLHTNTAALSSLLAQDRSGRAGAAQSTLNGVLAPERKEA